VLRATVKSRGLYYLRATGRAVTGLAKKEKKTSPDNGCSEIIARHSGRNTKRPYYAAGKRQGKGKLAPAGETDPGIMKKCRKEAVSC